MKFVQFASEGELPRVGVVVDGSNRVIEGHHDLLGLIQQGDIQHEEMLLSMGPVKGKDTATSLGQWLVTKDELEPYLTATGFDRAMSFKVNGVEYSRANWADVHYSFGEMVSYASRGTDVRPGDVFGSGTCGTGCILELSRTHGEGEFPWLQAGYEVLIEIEGLGTQRTTVAKTPEPASFRRPEVE